METITPVTMAKVWKKKTVALFGETEEKQFKGSPENLKKCFPKATICTVDFYI